MKYLFNSTVQNQEHLPHSWNKNSNRETLQYAIGALLYMPGNNIKIAEEIIDKKYPHLKSMVLCLEDSIGDCSVKEAEKAVKKILSILARALQEKKMNIDDLPLIFIRVRKPEQMMRIVSECRNCISVITGFIWPKFDKTNANKYISEFAKVRRNVQTTLYVMPIIESKSAMYKETRVENLLYIDSVLKSISEYVLGIRIGGTDFSNLYSVRRKVYQSIWDIKVIEDAICDIINIFARNYVVSGAVWEFFGKDETEEWARGLKVELEKDKLNGIIGKTSIHPSQLRIIQESLMVEYEDYRDAIEILGLSNQNLVGVQKSFGGNKMNEAKTHINWARKIICLANIYGVHTN